MTACNNVPLSPVVLVPRVDLSGLESPGCLQYLGSPESPEHLAGLADLVLPCITRGWRKIKIKKGVMTSDAHFEGKHTAEGQLFHGI